MNYANIAILTVRKAGHLNITDGIRLPFLFLCQGGLPFLSASFLYYTKEGLTTTF